MTDLSKLCHMAEEGKDPFVVLGQVYGKDIYIRVDWRDPEIARYEIAMVTDALKRAFYLSFRDNDSEGKEDKK